MGGAAGTPGQTDSHCVGLTAGCTCTGDPDNYFEESEGIASCTAAESNGFCCRTADFPLSISGQCECQGWGCIENAAGCICSQLDGDKPLKGCSQSWPSCCAQVLGDTITMCTCSDDQACDGPSDVQVPSCSETVVKCHGDYVETASCKG